MFKTPAKNMGIIESSKKPIIFTQGHDNLFRSAFNMFKDQPITGHGPKMFRVICKDEKYATGVTPCMTHPHNFYIQLLAETGLIGFLFLFSCFCYVVYCSFMQLKSILFKKSSTKFICDLGFNETPTFFPNFLVGPIVVEYIV